MSHGNSNHLITLGLFGDGEGSLVRFRSGALLRLKDDGYWGVPGGDSSGLISSAVPKSSSDAGYLCIKFHTVGLLIYS